MSVRVRFAPSPTGPLHIGGVRTALYNYLLATQKGGKFIVRIEDTDQNRFVPGAEAYIFESLRWIGITPDESPEQGGPYAPYRQSERKEIYKQYALQLVESGHAYYAFDTEEELDAMRERLKAAKVVNPQYNVITRTTMKNSLTLSEDEVKERLTSGMPYVIRLKVPRKEEIRLNDMIRGWVMVHSSALDDKVLMKSDGMPTYHLANVVDDYLMKITHVIRGEEWLPSAPTHVLLYKFLGWEASMPQFAHLPLLLKPDGNGKLSKRDADLHGFPIFPLAWKDPATGIDALGFREQGYYPEAVVNFLALLGWNPGTHQELFTMEELIQAFSVERIGKSGTKFDFNKAKWFNQQYLRKQPDTALSLLLVQALAKESIECSPDKAEKIVRLMKERAVFFHDILNEALILMKTPKVYSTGVADSEKWTPGVEEFISEFIRKIESCISFEAVELKSALNILLEEKGLKLGKVLPALRISLTGVSAGPDLMQIMEILGKEEALKRIKSTFSAMHPPPEDANS